jgi:MscS family membrane protein
VTSLVAGLGIGGLAFALAAQPLLTNLFGGLSIIADKPFHLGDRIRVDLQHEGIVREIGMRSTVIETANTTKLIIPNSVIASSVIENLSKYTDHATRVTFNVGLTYDTSNAKIRQAIDILQKILDSNKYVVKKDDLAPKAVFNELRDSSLNIYVAYSFIAKPPHTNNLRTEINLAIKEEFEKAGIEFAYPTQTVHVKND